MDWFEELFGFSEDVGYAATKRNFVVERPSASRIVLASKRNRAKFDVGSFECPSLSELHGPPRKRARVASASSLVFRNIIGDAGALHMDPANAGAVFQVASQFNCLEMRSPEFRPEDGITCYEKDRTQGPACALACPAATVFRNYFGMDGKGQAGLRQLNLLGDIAELLGNKKHKYWEMRNGYCLPTTSTSIDDLRLRLTGEEALLDSLRSRLRVGVHWSTQVSSCDHQVCQVFCSALPLAYAANVPAISWEPFARAILEAAYDATLAAAAKLANKRRNGRIKVFLTIIGGGAFGNPLDWIVDALEKALMRHRDELLDVRLVHFSRTPEAHLSNEDKTSLFGAFGPLGTAASDISAAASVKKRPAALLKDDKRNRGPVHRRPTSNTK